VGDVTTQSTGPVGDVTMVEFNEMKLLEGFENSSKTSV